MGFPSNWSQLAQVEKVLSKNVLNLSQMHAIEADLGSLIDQGSGETFLLAKELFEKVEDQRSGLVSREVALSRETFKWASEIAELRLEMPELTFEEAAEKILELKERFEFLSQQAPSTHSLQEVLLHSRSAIEHLHFQFVFPQIDELEEDSFQLNMIHSLAQIGQEIAETGSLEPFKKLSERQQEEVRKLIGPGSSPEGLSHGIELYQQSLLAQVKVAEKYFHGHESAEEAFVQLPEEIQERVHELEQEAGLLRTEALMYSLDERMS